MFSLGLIIGVVPVGTLQPAQLQIVGAFSCPGVAGGVPVELRITAPTGGPTTTFAGTTSAGAPGSPPVDSVTFMVPAWAAAVCGAKIAFEVRGNCGGQWTAWEGFTGEIDCFDCPRISLQTSYGVCSGTPPRQAVTITATVMLRPGATTNFTWDYGDNSSGPGGAITNNTGNWNTPFSLATTHDFDVSRGPYLVCLKPPQGSECPTVCETVTPDCVTVGCPTIAGSATVGACAANGSRPVSYTLTLTPPAPQNSTLQVSWAYGGPNAAGQTSASQAVNTTGGPISSITHTTDLTHRPGGYATTATIVLLINGQVCPVATSTVTIFVNPAPCLPCPDPARPITVTVTTPTSVNWCAPVQGLAATLAAQVNWLQPAPAAPPSPVRYDWTVTLPDGRVASQSSTAPTVSTTAGWSGAGSVNGAIDMNAAGSYAVGVAAVFSPNAGLPTDASGAISCQFVGASAIVLTACPSTTPCPTLTGLSATNACADVVSGVVANITATATVNDPAHIAQTYVWDFGDPGSTGNQMTTASTTAAHTYARPGSYTVTCRVQASVACTGTPTTSLSTTVAISQCPSPPSATPPSRIGCDALLWISLILIAISGVLAVIGCIISKSYPPAAVVLGIIAIVLLAIGLLLFLLWWAICRFFTACSVIITAIYFIGILIAIFFVVGIILAMIALFGADPTMLPCAFVSIVQSGIWGLLLYILYRIAVAVTCITENSDGPPPPKPPSSSSGGLSSSEAARTREWSSFGDTPHRMEGQVGLGDVVRRVTEAMGIRACAECHERAAHLNQLASFGGRRIEGSDS